MAPSSPTRQVVGIAAAAVAGLLLVAAGVIVGTSSNPNSGRSADVASSRSTDRSTLRRPAALTSIAAPVQADPAPFVPALEGVAGPPGPPPAPAPDPSPAPVLSLLPGVPLNRPELVTEPAVLEPLISILEEAPVPIPLPEAPAPPATPEPLLVPVPVSASASLPIAPVQPF